MMEETISLKEIFDVIMKRWKMIVSITVGDALLAALLSYLILTPIYEANTQFIVNQTEEQHPEYVQIDSCTIQTNVDHINTYNINNKGKTILDEVAEELWLNVSEETLAGRIELSSQED